MQRRSNTSVPVGMPITRLLSRSHLEIALGYLAGYVLLDWLSYVHPFASFGITPWNPPTGWSFALILLFGAEFVPWLFIAQSWQTFWCATCRCRLRRKSRQQ